MEFNELKKRLQAATMEHALADKKMHATLQLYEVCVTEKNGELELHYRNELHALLDTLLDSTSSIITISLMMAECY